MSVAKKILDRITELQTQVNAMTKDNPHKQVLVGKITGLKEALNMVERDQIRRDKTCVKGL